jgi:ferrous iron transport protein B
MDPIFKRVGLSGKSIIPFIISTGCGIPGIMSCRTIRDERERRATAMLATFMPCGAKIPVIALFSGIFFADAAWVSTLMYFTAIFIIFIGALLVREITRYKYRKSFFIMEMPEYKVPNFKLAVIAMLSRAKAYLVKAATIILVCNVVVQIMQSFNWQLQLVPEGMENTSILASVAGPIAVLLVPLGFGAWQLAAASVTGFIAKENVVGTLAVVYAMTNLVNPVEMGLVGDPAQVASIMGLTSASALAYLMFNLFTPPCFAAIGAMNSELNSKKWLAGAISLQFGTGYVVAFLVNQVGTLIMTGSFAAGFVPGLIAVLAMVAVLVGIIIKAKKNFSAEYANSRYTKGSVSA